MIIVVTSSTRRCGESQKAKEDGMAHEILYVVIVPISVRRCDEKFRTVLSQSVSGPASS